MRDGVPSGQGNSRLIKSVAAQIPGTYEEFRAKLVSGGIPFDLLLNEPGWQQLGTKLNKNNLLSDSTAAKLGLPADPTVDDALAAVAWAGASGGRAWRLIQSYTNAGTFTWTAPSIAGSTPYPVGIFVIGGGGGGGVAVGWASSVYNYYMWGGGGASGYTRTALMTVTPGQTYAVVVGAAGQGKAVAANAAGSLSGGAGGQSSFGGLAALGGSGGLGTAGQSTTSAFLYFGARGGQGASGAGMSNSSVFVAGETAPAMGELPNRDGGMCRFIDVLNPYTLMRYLGAGGGAFTHIGIPDAQIGATLDDGLVSGSGAAVYTNGGSAAQAVATSATSPGSGGGGAAVFAVGAATNVNGATSGNGAPGAVLIYV